MFKLKSFSLFFFVFVSVFCLLSVGFHLSIPVGAIGYTTYNEDFDTSEIVGGTPSESWYTYGWGVSDGCNIVDTAHYSGLNCFETKSLATNSYFNFTFNATYMNSFGFKLAQGSGGGAGETRLTLSGRDASLCYVEFSYVNPSVWNLDVGGTNVYTTNNNWTSFIFTRVSNTVVNLSLYKSTDSSYVYGKDISLGETWDDFVGLYIHCTATCIAFHIDDLFVNRSTFSSGGICDTTGYTPWYFNPIDSYSYSGADRYVKAMTRYAFDGVIHEVVLPISNEQGVYISSSTDDYTLYINGVDCGHPGLLNWQGGIGNAYWCGLDVTVTDEPLVFEFGCDAFGYVDGEGVCWSGLKLGDTLTDLCTVTNDSDLFGYGLIDGTIPVVFDDVSLAMVHGFLPDYLFQDVTIGLQFTIYYESLVNASEYTPIPPDVLPGLQDQFGLPSLNDSFIQFRHLGENCFYGVGSVPEIQFFFDRICCNSSNTSNVLIYKIFFMSSAGDIEVFSGPWDLGYHQNISGYAYVPWAFTESGFYYIVLYNTTNYGATVDKVIYTSQHVYVCEYGSGGGGGGGGGGGTGGDGGGAYTTPTDYAMVFGFVACLTIGLFVGYVTMNGLAFVGSFFGSLIFFSVPGQPFTYFPTIVLFLCGFVLILLVMALVFRR